MMVGISVSCVVYISHMVYVIYAAFLVLFCYISIWLFDIYLFCLCFCLIFISNIKPDTGFLYRLAYIYMYIRAYGLYILVFPIYTHKHEHEYTHVAASLHSSLRVCATVVAKGRVRRAAAF